MGDNLFNRVLREVCECQCGAEWLTEAGKKCVREVSGRDVASDLPVQFLESENELSDRLMGSLLDGVDLSE